MSAKTAARFVGQSVRRKEDPRLLAGRGRYTDDVSHPGQLHIAFLRSDHASARIKGIDTSAAAALEGVEAVFTAADLAALGAAPEVATIGMGAPYPPLAEERVRFVGEPIALVVARSRYVAEDACELIEVDLEPGAAVVRLDVAASSGAPLVHEERGSNVVEVPSQPNPAVDEALAGAAHVVTRTISMARMTNVPMEGRGMVAWWDPYARELRMWPSTQSPHELKRFAAALLQIPESQVRLEFGDVGGGFGQKMYATREEAAVLLVAKALGRPVKWIEDRRENLIAANQARHDVAEVTMALDEDLHITALQVDLVSDIGAMPASTPGGGSGGLAAMVFTGPYRIPTFGFASRSVFTNTAIPLPFRGPWAIESVAREQMIDAVAAELDVDPLELRRRNVIHASDLPYTLPAGLVYDLVTPEETMEQAVSMLDWAAFRAEQARARTEGRHLGVGLSVSIEPSAVAMGQYATEAATVRVTPAGTVEVLVGSGSHGHSVETTIAQVVADHLGCDIDEVAIRQGGDTPYGPGTGGSRTAVILGGAAQQTATTLRSKVEAIAAHLLEAAPEDIEVAGSLASVRGTPSRSVSFAELAAAAYVNTAALPPGTEPGLEVTSRYQPPGIPFTWSNATHLCTVEVDVETGLIQILRYIVSEDCGVMINPMVVEGQIAGGVVQGIGNAVYEHMAYDDEGNPLASTFLDYLVPTASEVPRLEIGHIETPSAALGGYKGMGEGGAIASPAAVANAVNDALSPLGVRLTSFPLSPDRILEAIEASGR